jgi:hypothetical protein
VWLIGINEQSKTLLKLINVRLLKRSLLSIDRVHPADHQDTTFDSIIINNPDNQYASK